MNDIGEKASPRRTITLRDLLTLEQAAHGARLDGPGTTRTDQGGADPGDKMEAAGEFAATATNAV
jgi:hypothetical protein